MKSFPVWWYPSTYKGKPVIEIRKRITNPLDISEFIQKGIVENQPINFNGFLKDDFKTKSKLKELGLL